MLRIPIMPNAKLPLNWGSMEMLREGEKYTNHDWLYRTDTASSLVFRSYQRTRKKQVIKSAKHGLLFT